MAQKLSEQINRYFNLMETIREQLYRVLPVSDRYLCVVSFSTQLQALQCVLVNKESLMEAKLIEGLTGAELTTYGQYLQLAEQWVAGGMQSDYPFAQDKDVYAEYRRLTRNEEPDAPEAQRRYSREQLNNIRNDILTHDRKRLCELVKSLSIATQHTTKDWTDQELREALFKFFGIDDSVAADQKDETTVQYIEGLPRHVAMKELNHLDMVQLHTLADAWSLDKSDDLHTMLSIAKGHILRTLKADRT